MEGFAIPALASAVAFAATSSGLLHPPASVALPFNCLHFRDFTAVGGLAALWLCLRVFLQGDLTLHFLKVSRTFAPATCKAAAGLAEYKDAPEQATEQHPLALSPQAL